VSTSPPYGPGGRSDQSTPGRADETMPWIGPTNPTGAPEDESGGKHRADEQPTSALPLAARGEQPQPSYWQGGATPASAPGQQQPEEPAIFPEGVYEEPPSRAGAHLWALLIALVLSPVAWFLVNDGSARIYWSLRSDPGQINLAGMLGLAVGLLVVTIVLLTARWSSIGVTVTGLLSLLVGLAFLVSPAVAFDRLESSEEPLRQFGGFGENLFAYAVESALRGQFLLAGFVLVLVGVVSHGARRKGRREEYARLAVRAARGTNPFA
jgi:hypothetical protein